MSRHILVVGSGSVGKRHARNFSALGCRISCVDPRADRRQELAAETPVANAFASLEEAIAANSFDGIVIASPPSLHVSQGLAAIGAGRPVLLEKPVASDLVRAQDLNAAAAAARARVLLGYTWRWWRPIERARRLVEEGAIGKLLRVDFMMSANLEDWHPWEKYQEFFMSSTALGGGALLDESHWIDLALWMFGVPASLYARVDKISALEIDTDDNVDIMWRSPAGPLVNIHLDIYGRPHEKTIRFTGSRGTLLWTPNRVCVGSKPEGWDTVEDFADERNDMFAAVARDFLGMLDGTSDCRCTLAEGIDVMRVVEAARRSHIERREYSLADLA
jgi:predicted dehydrogenase